MKKENPVKRVFATLMSCFVLLSATVSVPALAEARDEAQQADLSALQDVLTTASDGIQSVLDGAKTNIEELFGASQQIALENSESAGASANTSAQDADSTAFVPSNLDGVVWSADYKTCTLTSGTSVDGQDLKTEIDSHRYDMTTFIAEPNTSLSGAANGLFAYCSNLTTVDLAESFDTSSVTNMFLMFSNCSELKSLTLPEGFDTSSVTNMDGMFMWCFELTSLTLSPNFVTAQATMSQMFDGYSPRDTALPFRSLTVSNEFTMKTGTGLPGFTSQAGYKNYWISDINTCANYNTTEEEAVANMNSILAASTDDLVTFSNVNIALSFDANGGTYPTANGAQDSSENADEVRNLFGNTNDAIDPSYIPAPKLPDFKVAGWSDSRDGDIVPLPNKFPDTAATYYAVWTPAVILTFDANGHGSFPGDNETLDIECIPGEKLTLPAEDALTVESGYAFDGWFTEASGGTQVTNQTDCPVTGTTYFAHYTEVPDPTPPGPTPDPTPEPTPEPAPDVVPAVDTDVLPVTGDTSAALSSSLFVVLLGVLTLIASGYSLSRRRSL